MFTERQEVETAREPQPGDSIGPYRIESLLGEGGMGRVYKALGPDGKPVALKVVKAKIAQDPVYRRRFDREARVAARIQHRHVVPVLAAGEHHGVPYMAQEFIPGGSLQDRIDSDGPLDLRFAIRLCLEIASGLDALHAQGLVHRDLKPGNILLDNGQTAFITDFGLAKQRDASVLTMPGQALGSMDYMAPEQIRGREVSPATDVYAFGCVMSECMCGHPPFADRQGMQILWAHLQDDPPDPCAERDDVPREMGWAITRALEKDPARRPPSATAYARILQAAGGAAPATGGDAS